MDDIVEWDRSAEDEGVTGAGASDESNEEDVITMGPATATKPAAKPAKANEWTGRRGGKREDTGDLDIDNI